MSKKKKAKVDKLKPQADSLQTLPPSEKKKMKRETLFFSIVTLILLVTVFDIYLTDANTAVLFSVVWRTLVVSLLMIRAGLNRMILKSMTNHKDYVGLPVPKKIYYVMRLLSTIIIALIVFPAFYLSPFREQISEFLVSVHSFTKSIAESVYNILSIVLASISGYIGNIILGALGNLFYDFTKSLYKKFSPEKNKRKKLL